MNYKVLIPTSGAGSRLGDFTEHTNKSLAPVGEKPALCHIIDGYDDDVEFIILLGHFGDHVRGLLELVYPKRRITFVTVDNYSGPGSSLVYSILQAEDLIDSPFILHACDTLLVDEPVPAPERNWLGGSRRPASSQYTTFDVSYDAVTRVYEKGQKDFDFAFIGIAGIHEYNDFFLEANRHYVDYRKNSHLSNIHVHSSQIRRGVPFTYQAFETWTDVGNIDALKRAQELFPKTRVPSLPKQTEAIYVVNDRVVKFFADSSLATKRVLRAGLLQGAVPAIQGSKDNFYCYDYVEGDVLSSVVTPRLTEKLLAWAEKHLWRQAGSSTALRQSCHRFYYDKTRSRLDRFFRAAGVRDTATAINGRDVPGAREMLEGIPEKLLCDATASTFHGDFILDNIVYTPEKAFVLMDWRQDFGGQVSLGDMYYDLAKLNCSFLFNQNIVRRDLFTVVEDKGDVTVDIMVSSALLDCHRVFLEWLEEHRYDKQKVDVLSALIWLNMAAMHDCPLSVFLYYFGRLKLSYAMEKCDD